MTDRHRTSLLTLKVLRFASWPVPVWQVAQLADTAAYRYAAEIIQLGKYLFLNRRRYAKIFDSQQAIFAQRIYEFKIKREYNGLWICYQCPNCVDSELLSNFNAALYNIIKP